MELFRGKVMSEEKVTLRGFWSRPLLGLTGLTPRILVIAVILWFINIYMYLLFETKYVSTSAYQIPAGIYLLFLLLIDCALSRNKRGNLSGAEYAVLISLGAVTLGPTAWIGNPWATNFCISPISFMSYFYTANPELWNLVPSSWIPKDPALIEAWLNGGPLDWGPWISPFFIWSLYYLITIVSIYFFQLLLRKPIIDVERAPFPFAMNAIELIKHAKAEEGRRSVFSPRNIPEFPMFWFGVFMGMFVIGSYTFSAWMPWIVRGWPEFNVPFLSSTGGGGWLYLDIYLKDVLPGPSWVFQFDWTRTWAITAFAPMSVLYTAIITMIVIQYIIPLVGVSLGILDWSYRGGFWASWYYEEQAQYGFAFDHLGIGGWLYGLGVAVIIFNWRHIASTLRKAIKGEPRELGEPWSWRTVWIVWPLTGIISIGLMLVSGISFILAVALYLQTLLLCLFATVIFSKFGASMANNLRWSYVSAPIKDLGSALGYWGNPPGTAAFTTIAFSNLTLNYIPWHYSWQSGGGLGIHKLSKDLGADERAVSLALLIAMGVLLIVIGPLTFWWIHVAGGQHMIAAYGLAYDGGWGTQFTAGSALSSLLNNKTEELFSFIVNPYPAAVAGFIACIIVFFMHARFAWFFLDPVGVLVGGSAYYWWPSYGGSILMMTAIRYLVMRIGGARVYNKYWIPFTLGVFAGLVVPNLFVGIVLQVLGYL
jgi:hypothetical protein